MKNPEYIIDATGKSLGRVATEAAVALRGKDKVTFQKNMTGDVIVKITNASKMAQVSHDKKESKIYHHYSGYPGGMIVSKAKDVVAKKGNKELFRLAVHGMLPTNKLRPIMMKNLIVEE